MAVIYKCDLCSKEMERYERRILILERDDPSTLEIDKDLCKECSTYLNQWVKKYD